MTRKEAFTALKEVLAVIRPAADLDAVNFETQLTRDLGLDSLSMMLMAPAVEQKLGLTFENTTPFNTVADVCDYVASIS